MYYFMGHTYLLTKIANFFQVGPKDIDLSSKILAKHYASFLYQHSVFTQGVLNQSMPMVIPFSTLQTIAPIYYASHQSHFIKNSNILTERLHSHFFQDAFLELKHLDPMLYAWTQFAVKVIVVNHMCSYTNGTTEDTLGLSIMHFKDTFQAIDFIELVIHQLTHMLLFLLNGMEPQVMTRYKETLIPTRIQFVLGGQSFPMYLAFHSYLVGIEILHFRDATDQLDIKANYHGSTGRVIKLIKQFYEPLSKYDNYLTPHGRDILHGSYQSVEPICEALA